MCNSIVGPVLGFQKYVYLRVVHLEVCDCNAVLNSTSVLHLLIGIYFFISIKVGEISFAFQV